MLKVFVVEDEPMVRERIRDILLNNKEEFIYCGEASDGELAYAMITEIRPDIVITDIKMPFVDGIELSKLIKKDMPWIKIIIISAYEEFSFAKEALSIGIEEYIIKPVTSSEILETLKKVKNKIEDERLLMINLENLEKEVNENKNILEKRFFNKLLFGTSKISELYEEANRLNLNIVAKYYNVVSMEYYPNNLDHDTYEDFLKLQEIINKILKTNEEVLIAHEKSYSEIIMLIKGNNKKLVEEKAFSIAQALQYEIERNTPYKIYIGIGNIYERLSDIPKSYIESQKAKSISLVLSHERIVGTSDLEFNFEKDDNIKKIELVDIESIIRYNEKDKVDKLVDKIANYFVEFKNSSFVLSYYLYLDIAFKCFKILREYGGEIKILNKMISPLYALQNMSEAQFKSVVKDLIHTTMKIKLSSFSKKYDCIIKKAKEFIEENYVDPSLSLSTVAEKVNMSMSHFSFIFKQETGETFIEYLTNLRINKAKELLLNSDLKNVEIATKVGYNEPHYFSYIFKRKTGMSPQEFRTKNNKPTEE